jgi:hypothetical protein
MRIRFERFPDHAPAHSVIERDDGVVYHMAEFTRGGTELPHDLRHFVVERELAITDGIWGCIAAGTVYNSMRQVRGRATFASRQRETALKKAQRPRIMRAELFANLVEAIAMLPTPSIPEIQRLTREKLSVVPLSEPGQDPADVVGAPPPEVLETAASALQVTAARWARLRVGEELVYEWLPTVTATAPAVLAAAAGRQVSRPQVSRPQVPRPQVPRPQVPRQREPGDGRDRRDPRRSGGRGPR